MRLARVGLGAARQPDRLDGRALLAARAHQPRLAGLTLERRGSAAYTRTRVVRLPRSRWSRCSRSRRCSHSRSRCGGGRRSSPSPSPTWRCSSRCSRSTGSWRPWIPVALLLLALDPRRRRARPAARDARRAGRRRDRRPAGGRVRLDAREGRRADAPRRRRGGDDTGSSTSCRSRTRSGSCSSTRRRPIVTPPTHDREDVRQAILYLRPESGTAIGDGLAVATRLVQRSVARAVRARRRRTSARRDRPALGRHAVERPPPADRRRGAREARGHPGLHGRARHQRPEGGRARARERADPGVSRPGADAHDRDADERRDVHGDDGGRAERRLRPPQLADRPREAQPRHHLVVRRSPPPACCWPRSCSGGCSRARCRAEPASCAQPAPRGCTWNASHSVPGSVRTSRCGSPDGRNSHSRAASSTVSPPTSSVARAREHDDPLVLLLQVVGRRFEAAAEDLLDHGAAERVHLLDQLARRGRVRRRRGAALERSRSSPAHRSRVGTDQPNPTRGGLELARTSNQA